MKDTTVVFKHCIPCNIMQTKLQSEQIGYFKEYCNQKGQCCREKGMLRCCTDYPHQHPSNLDTAIISTCVFLCKLEHFLPSLLQNSFYLSPLLSTHTQVHIHRLTHVSICIYTHNISKHSYFADTGQRKTRFILTFPSKVLGTTFHVSNNYR